MSEGLEQRRFTLAWEHFKFHADQRTKMFNFFLITVALLVNAFAFLLRADPAYYDDAFILLCIGGFFSTMFFCLDVRNTQLLEYSEALLRKIEEGLYPDDDGKWRGAIDGGQIKLGIISRESILKEYIRSNKKIRDDLLFRWFCVDNIKHKFAIRFIVMLAIFSFWSLAWLMAPSNFIAWVLIGFAICVGWAVWAMLTPKRDHKREAKALSKLDKDRGSAKDSSSQLVADPSP